MFSEETRLFIALNEIDDLGCVLIKRLLLRFQSTKKIFNAELYELSSVEGIGVERAKKIKQFDKWVSVDKIIKTCESQGIKIYSFTDIEYPKLLKEIYDPPVVLFCKGEIKLEDHNAIAVVGSRKPTEYGRRVTEALVSEIVSYELTVVSGLARGIDSISHSAALSAGGRTIAILGSGLSWIYPPENKVLAEKIAKNGAILSEFYPEVGPKKEYFPKRNRVISGMTVGTVVTEAAINSGALITVSFALEQGREVFAVPGNITSKNSEGTNYLIQKGAKLVTKVEDIVEEIIQFIPSLKESVNKISKDRYEPQGLDKDEKILFNILDDPLYLDEIVLKTGINVTKVLEILLKLEISGLIKKVEGKYVRRI